jgi:hypothetical protein
MDDRPRQVPQQQPGLRMRQQGNFISVRQKPDQDGGWGTLLHPKRFELPLLTPHRLKSRLGYEAVPASEFWQFSVSGRVRLQVNRLSADRYANSVGVALLDQANRRVAPLVQSASGRGEPVEIGPGTYKVVASLGIAENLKDLVFEFHTTPLGGALVAVGSLLLQGRGQLLRSRASCGSLDSGSRFGASGRSLAAAASLMASASGRLRASHLSSVGLVTASGSGTLAASARTPLGAAAVLVAGRGRLRAQSVAALRALAQVGGLSGSAKLRGVRWLADPDGNWRARSVGGVVELNSSYVNFKADGATQQQLLRALAAALN